jgi:hypothetical protein
MLVEATRSVAEWRFSAVNREVLNLKRLERVGFIELRWKLLESTACSLGNSIDPAAPYRELNP